MSEKERPTEADLSAYIDGEDACTADLDGPHRRLLQHYGRVAHWTRRALAPRQVGDAGACAERVIAALATPANTLEAPTRSFGPFVMASLGVLTVAGIAAGFAVRRHRGGAR